MAMADAEVGDDVLGDDPTVLRLQERIAGMLGKEAALFMPSGTMANQVAVRMHCQPGDEFLCEAGCHIYNYEQAAYAQLSGVAARTIAAERGLLSLDQLCGTVHPDDEHLVRTRLLCLEITHNRGGGSIPSIESVEQICSWARNSGLRTHLDGARLFNAVVATGVSSDRWSAGFDTVSVCFSKGLGAPVGSALAGPRDLIALARRHRKLFGGGMRQVGILAAGALYALEHQVERLADDHRHAKILAEAVQRSPGLALDPEQVDTNIVIFRAPEVSETPAETFISALAARGVWALPFSAHHVRLVTHLDVSPAQAVRAAEILEETANSLARR